MSNERRPLQGVDALGRAAGDGVTVPRSPSPSARGGHTNVASTSSPANGAASSLRALHAQAVGPGEEVGERGLRPSGTLPPVPPPVRGRPLRPQAPVGANGHGPVVVVAPPEASTTRDLIHWTAVVGGALLVALVVKLFLFQAFMIPSESMVPTLGVGDRVLVNKLSYQLHDVHRGDLIVFERPPLARSPGDDSDLIKRVVGLPGETVEARDGVVLVDGEAVPERYLPADTVTADFPRITLGPDEVWVMGDNRGNSRDSRVFGPLPEDLIIGRAFVRVWPLGDLTLF